jgi:hypothetical protein
MALFTDESVVIKAMDDGIMKKEKRIMNGTRRLATTFIFATSCEIRVSLDRPARIPEGDGRQVGMLA